MQQQCKKCNVLLKPKNRSKSKKLYCKPCVSEYQRHAYKKNLQTHLKAQLKRYYSITLEEYLNILEKQNGVCAICKLPESNPKKSRLSVDHDHTTHKVRGLLCDDCNNMLGRAKDSTNILLSGVSYLKLFGK